MDIISQVVGVCLGILMIGMLAAFALGAVLMVGMIAVWIAVFLSVVWLPLALSLGLAAAAGHASWVNLHGVWHLAFVILCTGLAGTIGLLVPWILTFAILAYFPREILLSIIVACSSALWFVCAWLTTGLMPGHGGDLIWACFAAAIGAFIGLGCGIPIAEVSGRKDLKIMIEPMYTRLPG
jgi:hypothetical protein